MLWKNGQDVDSLMLASICVYCSENLSDLGERQTEGKAEIQGQGEERQKEKEHKNKGKKWAEKREETAV